MSDVFLGQIMMTGFNYAQRGFARCDGATLPIAQNYALYALVGRTYGGDGVTTFKLPDLRGRTPAGGFASQNPNWQPAPFAMGEIAGAEAVSLTADQNGPHTHMMAATTAEGVSPYLDGAQTLAQTSSPGMLYGQPQGLIPLTGNPTTVAGAGQPHDNMQPFQVINFNIALQGVFPSRG